MKNFLRKVFKDSNKPTTKTCVGCMNFWEDNCGGGHCSAPYEHNCHKMGHLFYQLPLDNNAKGCYNTNMNLDELTKLENRVWNWKENEPMDELKYEMESKVNAILWRHVMCTLGYTRNYENDTFIVKRYNWNDERNDWNFWHKPSGLKVAWYKYPFREPRCNMEITNTQFLDILEDCLNSADGDFYKNDVRQYTDIDRWWENG